VSYFHYSLLEELPSTLSVFWSPTDHDPNLTVTGYRTILNTAGGWYMGRANQSRSDRRYFELKYDDPAGNNDIIAGIANASALTGDFVGQNANSIGLWRNGPTVFTNGSSVAPISGAAVPAFNPGDIIGFDVDGANQQIRFNVNGGTFSGWYSIPFTGPYFPAASFSGAGDVVASFMPADLSFTPPSPATAWGATASATTFPQAVTIACTTALAISKRAGKTLPISSTTALAASRRVGKVLSIASVSALSAIKRVNKALSIASITATTGTAAKAKIVNVAIACSTAVTKQLSVGKRLAIASTTALVASKTVGKALSIASVSAVTAVTIKVKIVNVAIACTTAVTMGAKGVSKSLAISSTSSVAAARSVGKKLAIASTTALAKQLAVVKALSIASVSAVTVGTIKVKIVNVAIACATAVSNRLATSKSFAISVTTSLTASRSIAKRLAVACTSAASALAARGTRVVVTIAVTTGVSASRAVGKVISVSVVSQFTMARGITKTVIIVCKSAVTRILTSSVVVVGAYARRVLGRATALFVTGRAPIAVITGRSGAQIVGTAMTTTHDPINFICGDTWQLTGPLQDASGNALNLTGATITWKLDGQDGLANLLTLDNAGSGGVSVVNPSTATILVNVSKVQSAALQAGTYKDWLRVTLADGTQLTEWTGIIKATAQPA
jgi:hypothetical protein